jgi:FkbM family methyltransferase
VSYFFSKKVEVGKSLLKRLIDGEGFNAVVKARYGYLLYNKNDIYIGRGIERYGEWSEFEVELFRQICQPSDVVVEVGSNIGSQTIALSQMVGNGGRVYAFEPQRIIFQTLCANMALNSITNVECFQAAVASSTGFIFIPDIDYHRESNFGGVSVDVFEQGFKVPKIKLDEFLEIPRLKLIKIDAEGMEAEVIKGAAELIEKFKPILYVENDRQEKSENLINTIRSLDYKLYRHAPYYYNPNNFAAELENIYPGLIAKNILCLHQSSKIELNGFTEVLS